MQRPFAKATTTAAAVLALLGGLAPWAAQAAGHYVPGVEGLQNASVPPPGFYYLGYLVHYDIGSFRAPGTSSNLPGSNKGNVTALANRFVWMTGHKLLGADYGVEAIVPIVRTSLKVSAAGLYDSHTGLGDVYLGPLVLGWHGPQWDAVAAAGMWLDTGSTSDPASAGNGYKSTMLTGGLTYYFDSAKTLSGAGPFTVFAPTNAAFDKLPAGTVDTLLKPENKDQLVKILTCHVVGAKALAADVQKMVADDGGMHVIKTVGGCEFTAMVEDGMVKIKDGQGNVATVTVADVVQSNGVIHVIDTVLLPAM